MHQAKARALFPNPNPIARPRPPRGSFTLRAAPLLLFALLASLAVVLVPLAHATAGASLVVNTTTDEDTNGDTFCSLREAITAANNNANYHDCTGTGYGADTITFSVNGAITLGSVLPAIDDDLTIDASGQKITVDGNSAVRPFWVNGSKTLSLISLTVANGLGGNDCGEDCGGGILNSGTVNLTDVTMTNNYAGNDGGAIFNGGTLNATNTTFEHNTAGGGGGIRNNGTANITASTFFDNTANDGGGILSFDYGAVLNITNSTFYENNSGVMGGGITNYGGTAHVINSTFSRNRATTSGGGFENFLGTATFFNTIIANSTSGGDCANGGTLTADSTNFDTDGSCDGATTKTTAQLNLGELQDNGGLTQTVALGTGSAAINAGDDTRCANPIGAPTYGAGGLDQRSITRPAVDCDSGAYEVESAQAGPNLLVTRSADTDSGVCGVVYCTLREAINAANSLKGANTITFNIPAGNIASNSGCSAANLCTITLSSTLPIIDDDVAIDGSANAAKITLDGNSNVRIMEINPEWNVTLDTLTFVNGKCSNCDGGAIYNRGILIVSDSTFSGNDASVGFGDGGAIMGVTGTLDVRSSTFADNTGGNGAGIFSSGGILIVTNSTFSNNSALGTGGGIYIGDTGYVVNTTLSGNGASGGGGGGIATSGTLNYANTLIANSTAGGDCLTLGSGAIGTNTRNLVEDGSCSATLSGDPNLSSLADNGGPTETMAIPTNSPALDAGDTGVCQASVSSTNFGAGGLDQRGEPRPDGKCDIGAFERQVAYLTVIKHVDNSQGGTATASDWTMNVSGVNPSKTSFPGAEVPGVRVILDPGAYSVTESGGPAGYQDSYSADCSGTLAVGDNNSCTITNAQFTPTPTITPTATATPSPCFAAPPALLSPANGAQVVGKSVTLDWQDAPCAAQYKLRVRQDSKRGPLVLKKNGLTLSTYTLSLTPPRVNLLLWRVKACDATQCGKWSEWSTVKFIGN